MKFAEFTRKVKKQTFLTTASCSNPSEEKDLIGTAAAQPCLDLSQNPSREGPLGFFSLCFEMAEQPLEKASSFYSFNGLM